MACLLATTACKTVSPPVTEVGAAGAQLSLLLADSRIELLRAVPSAWLDGVALELDGGGDKDSDLRWEMRSSAGARLAGGEIPDPRGLRVEAGMGMMGEDGPITQLGASGVAHLLVPDVAGTLTFFVADGALLAEFDYQPINGRREDAADLNAGKTDFSRDSDVLGEPVLLGGDGIAERHYNILFVPEGYQEAELELFHTQLDSLLAAFVQLPPYDRHLSEMNLWRQDIRSRESGISSASVQRDTAFNMEFGDGIRRVTRCILPSDNWTTVSAANLEWLRDRARADLVVVIANTPGHGGCAQRGNLVTLSFYGSGEQHARTLAHEMGHALFGLADEYEDASAAAHCNGGPNIADSLDAIPWLSRISPSTPIPTPTGTAGIGAFAGGGACAEDRWRPEMTCMMRNLRGAPFCEVCTTEIEAAFVRRDLDLREVEIVNRAGFAIMAGCGGIAAPDCSAYVEIADGESAVIQIRESKFNLYALSDTVHWPTRLNANAYRLVIHDHPTDPFSDDGGTVRDAGMDSRMPDAGLRPSRIRRFASSGSADIPDNDPAGVRSDIEVDGSGAIRFLTVQVAITHPYRGDLEVVLQKDRQRVTLVAREGGGADDLNRTFDVPDFVGTAAAGTWTLHVIDHARADRGTLDEWKLAIETDPAVPTVSEYERSTLYVIPDAQPFVVGRDRLTVPDRGEITGLQLTVDLTHEAFRELDFMLLHAGVTVPLPIDLVSGTFEHTYTLSEFDGQDLSGNWSLTVDDRTPGNEGTLNRWMLSISHR